MGQTTFVTLAECDTRAEERTDGRPPQITVNFYFGDLGVATTRPQAFRSTHEPHSLNRAHFHHTDQFQIFLGGPDTSFERELCGPLLVHYADADTLYGPFGSTEHGFRFFTLRRHGSGFVGHMPEDKSEMSHDRVKRHYKKDFREWFEEPYPPTGEVANEAIIEPQVDNLAAFKITVAPGAKATGPTPNGFGGQYYLIIDGELSNNDKVLSTHTLGWVGPDDEPPILVAGENGARLLVLQFGSEHAGRKR